MSNNLIDFINGKMGKIYIEVGIIRTLLSLLDNKLYNKDVLKDFTEEEIKELRVTLYALEKIKAKEEGNSSMYLLSKLMLNSLYGKFALNPHIRSKIPFYNKLKKKVQFKLGDEEIRDGIYLPVGAFITSYAREITITAAQSQFDRFMYADTDSIHLEGMEMPNNIEVHSTKLGAWDYEGKFDKAYYIRQKTYIEHLSKPNKDDYKWKITCAGMPEACYKNVTFDNFRIGSKYEGKLITKRIDGGISLEDSTFKIKMI